MPSVNSGVRAAASDQRSRPDCNSWIAAAWYQLPQVDGRFGKFGHSLGLAVATSPETRLAPGGKSVDLSRPLIQLGLIISVSP